MQYFNEMLKVAREFGLLVEDIVSDNQIHRVATLAKPSKKNGWYVATPESCSIYMGDWQTGHTQSWYPQRAVSSIPKRDTSEHLRHQQQLRASKALDGIERARSLYESGEAVSSHPYLKAKHIASCDRLRCHSGNLLVPLFCIVDKELQVMNIQTIYPNGQKRFLKHATTKALCFPVGEISENVDEVYICEGMATAITLHMVTKYLVLAAMNAGNLFAIANNTRKRWPQAKIIIAGDDDWLTQERTGNNPGKKKAIEAAHAVDGYTCFPPFTREQQKINLTDWNDYLFKSLERVV